MESISYKLFKAKPFLCLFLLIIATSLKGQAGEGSFTAGTTVTKDVPFSRETINEVKERAAMRPVTTVKHRVIPKMGPPNPKMIPSPEKPPESKPEGAAPSESKGAAYTPSLSTSFIGLGDDNTAIPPDTIGAVGPNHIMEPLNTQVVFFSKAGSQISSPVSLQSFWSSLGTGSGEPAETPFDPKVLYDQYDGHFVFVSMGGGISPSSWLLVGVSNSSDPTASWCKWAIDADLNGGSTQTNNWADYPGFGLDADNLYVSANMFSNPGIFQYSKVWVIPKAQLYSCSASISWTEFNDLDTSWFTILPAHTFGTSSAEYLVANGYYMQSSQLLRLAEITSSGGTPSFTDLGYIQGANYPNLPLSDAPQQGSNNTIDTGDTRLMNAVSRNGYLWTTHHVAGSSTPKTEIAWYQLDPATASTSSPYGTPYQQGRISDSSRWYYYPSIAVNSNGDAVVGFSGSSSTEYAGAYYTGRQAGDASGTMQSVALLKAGEASYYKTYGGTENRWGDYSATCVDPSDDTTFWTVQEYAATPSGGYDQWGTWWGNFSFTTTATLPAAPSNLAANAGSSSQVTLAWTDNSDDESSFKIERKTGATGTYAQLATVSANVTNYTDTGLSEATTYYYRMGATNSAGNSPYSSEANATTFPTAPSGLIATVASTSEVTLTWTDNSNGESGIKVERSADNSTFSLINTLGANTTSYTDSGLNASTTYYYRVGSYNGSGTSYSAAASATTLASSGEGGSGGGCFIATAAYGSYLDPHVMVLREFRDRYLLTNAPGRRFVALYYRYSPPIADFIKEHEALRTVTRWCLTPLIYTVEYPSVFGIILIGALLRLKKRKLYDKTG